MPGVGRALGLAVSILVASVAHAAAQMGDLVMFETDQCAWCRLWHRDIGPIYPKSAEGRDLPLRRVDLAVPRPSDLASIMDIRYTPTFVVVVDGRELGRIVGYPGQDHFWAFMSALHARVKGAGAGAGASEVPAR